MDKLRIIVGVLSAIGFLVFGILTEFNTDYDIGVALGFMIGVSEMLLVFTLAKKRGEG